METSATQVFGEARHDGRVSVDRFVGAARRRAAAARRSKPVIGQAAIGCRGLSRSHCANADTVDMRGSLRL